MTDVVVIGGGIVGLSAARAVQQRYPGASVVVAEKEPALASHQTGRNSGVVHSGIYYKPGSLKARTCIDGGAELVRFCQEHGIAYEQCGKLIVATDPSELPRLEALAERATAHGLAFTRLGPDGIRDHEPHAAGIAALHLPITGIVDYLGVCAVHERELAAAGGEVRLDTKVLSIEATAEGYRLVTNHGPLLTRSIVNCAGLHSDRVAKAAGAAPDARIVPFRGEYFDVVESRRHLVNTLIYPVPDPAFPFLGVHFTKMVSGAVHAGPNAVLALRREGYRWRDINLRDLADTLSYSGFWRLARKHGRTGMGEVARSLSKERFTHSLQRLVPEIQADDLVRSKAGVRAQALTRDGGLVDDFLITGSGTSVHVCNAPSPAATSSLAIGASIAERLELPLLAR